MRSYGRQFKVGSTSEETIPINFLMATEHKYYRQSARRSGTINAVLIVCKTYTRPTDGEKLNKHGRQDTSVQKNSSLLSIRYRLFTIT
jgi:hypothetical protein